MLNSLTNWVLAHKRLVAVFWILVTIIGIGSASSATKALSQKFSIPGREAYIVNQEVQRVYHTNGNSEPLIPVVTLPPGTTVDTPGVAAQFQSAVAHIAGALPVERAADYFSTHNRAFVSADGRTTFALVYPRLVGNRNEIEKGPLDAAKAAASSLSVAGAPVHLTGISALRSSSNHGNGPGVFLEAVIGGFGALIVLAFVFASFIAVLPLLMAIVSILTTFLLIWALTAVTEVSFIVEFLVALIGLGVAIDYSLLVVVRWREEHQKGADNDTAIRRAMATSGRAVVFSGTTVAIGLLSLVVLPLPFLRSVGYGGLLIPLVSVIVSMTLLPAILGSIGPRLDWPHIRHDDRASRSWTAWATWVTKHRVIAAAAALAILVALLIPATTLYPGEPRPDSLAKSGDARAGLVALERSGIGPGALTPLDGIATGSASAAVSAAAQIAKVRGAVAPTTRGWQTGGTALFAAIPTIDGNSSAGRTVISNVRAATHNLPGNPRVGGAAAGGADFSSAVYGSFPLMIALVVIVTFVLLARAFRSLLLPAKAVVLNVLSVAAAYGFLVLVWQDGHGSQAIWGVQATGAITEFVPLMVFAFLFGLSMDYEVFILARMREEYDATGSTREAVVRGIGRTGRLVTSAALILFLAFAALASGPEVDIKIFATGLAAGILIDATIVRGVLVPALVSIFGRWNWWLPEPARRLLRIPQVVREPAPVTGGGYAPGHESTG